MSTAPILARLIFICSKCGEHVRDHHNQPNVNHYKIHAKYCTPNRKTAKQIAADKEYDRRVQEAEDAPINYRTSRTTYTGRMFHEWGERMLALMREAESKAIADRPQIDTMINEGGRA